MPSSFTHFWNTLAVPVHLEFPIVFSIFFLKMFIIPHFQFLILSLAIYSSINQPHLFGFNFELYNLISGNSIISSGLCFKIIFIVSIPCRYIQFFKNFCIYLEILIAESLESIFMCI